VSSERFSLAARLKARLAHLGQDYCIFTCSGRDFAVSVSAAHEVLAGEAATPVPQAPDALVGVINLRGEVLPLVQLDSLLGMATRPYVAGNQIVVVSSGEIGDVGLVVDRVRDVRSIDPKEITSCPTDAPGHRLCRGDWHSQTGIVAVLDAEKVIAEAVKTISVRFQQRVSGRNGDIPARVGVVSMSNE
jgi:purine-binding chemotaxis protein CheW